MAIFMKFEGITGESEVSSVAGYIELMSFGWGLHRNTNTMRAASRGQMECVVREVTVTKKLDGSSIGLTGDGLFGGFDREVKIAFVRTGNGEAQIFANYTLKQCGVSSYEIAAAEDGSPIETISLNFTEIEMSYSAVGDGLMGVQDTVYYALPSASGS